MTLTNNADKYFNICCRKSRQKDKLIFIFEIITDFPRPSMINKCAFYDISNGVQRSQWVISTEPRPCLQRFAMQPISDEEPIRTRVMIGWFERSRYPGTPFKCFKKSNRVRVTVVVWKVFLRNSRTLARPRPAWSRDVHQTNFKNIHQVCKFNYRKSESLR